MTTYNPDGTQTTPTISEITAGSNNPYAVAVDAAGKIYVLNSDRLVSSYWTVTAFKPHGTQTVPVIAAGLSGPSGIAVDAQAKSTLRIAATAP